MIAVDVFIKRNRLKPKSKVYYRGEEFKKLTTIDSTRFNQRDFKDKKDSYPKFLDAEYEKRLLIGGFL